MADTIPVSSSTDWQAAFGFGSSNKQQEDDLGFDPFDITSKALADLIEKELTVQDKSSLPMSHMTPAPGFPPYIPSLLHSAKGPMLPPPASSTHLPPNCGLASQAFSHHLQQPHLSQRLSYGSFSLPGHTQTLASRHSWLTTARANLPHLNHTAQHSNSFMDLTLPPQQQQQHSTGLGGIPITGEYKGLSQAFGMYCFQHANTKQHNVIIKINIGLTLLNIR